MPTNHPNHPNHPNKSVQLNDSIKKENQAHTATQHNHSQMNQIKITKPTNKYIAT